MEVGRRAHGEPQHDDVIVAGAADKVIVAQLTMRDKPIVAPAFARLEGVAVLAQQRARRRRRMNDGDAIVEPERSRIAYRVECYSTQTAHLMRAGGPRVISRNTDRCSGEEPLPCG